MSAKELNIGDYVRTKDGFIARIKEIEQNERLHLFLKAIYTDNYKIDMVLEDEIIKNSSNIIDLIEVGDVIVCDNKKYAINYEFEVDYNDDYKDYEITIDDYITLFLKDGLSIVTKEQFEAMKYEL